jgi:hypothetical protein
MTPEHLILLAALIACLVYLIVRLEWGKVVCFCVYGKSKQGWTWQGCTNCHGSGRVRRRWISKHWRKRGH